MTHPARREIRRVEQVMGTAFGITVGADNTDGTVDEVLDETFAWLRWVDRTFSTYRDDSEISRIDQGSLGLDEASPEVREVLVRCAELAGLTDGWFTARPRNGETARLDPSGLVKGWSIDRAGMMLQMAGFECFAINGGGDILCGAPASASRGWRVGIRHPTERHAVAAVLVVDGVAIATSGTYERGAHLWGRSGSACRTDLSSVTVLGPELGTADALATAVFVEGSGAPPWFDRFPGYERLVITGSSRVRWTSGLDDLLAAKSKAGVLRELCACPCRLQSAWRRGLAW